MVMVHAEVSMMDICRGNVVRQDGPFLDAYGAQALYGKAYESVLLETWNITCQKTDGDGSGGESPSENIDGGVAGLSVGLAVDFVRDRLRGLESTMLLQYVILLHCKSREERSL